MPSQIYARAQKLRREVAEIEAADILGHHSGAEKVKHDKRIQRLWEIRNELFALIAPNRAADALAREFQ
jgi:tRNA G37 N-methylase TrmD